MNTFKKLNAEEIAKLNEQELNAYSQALHKHQEDREIEIAKRLMELDNSNEAHKNEIAQLKSELQGIDAATIKEVVTALKKQGETLKGLVDNGQMTKGSFKATLKASFDSNKEVMKAKADKAESHRMTVSKASQTYGDINSGLDFAQMRAGIFDKPVRRVYLRSLFSIVPLSTEFYKYVEQDTVIRDAKNVAKCTPITSTTKETLIVRSIETKVIKDMIDFCRTFISDYPFMASRINKLINESIALRVDAQILNGTGLGDETFSINSVSSEFSAANPVGVVTTSIQDANMVDLALAMAMQIEQLGQMGSYMPDTILVNKVDWFIKVEQLKDANNNYLDTRITKVGNQTYLNGMLVLPLPTSLLAQNKMFVFDSTKAEIIDRQELILETSFENRDNWEKEIGTLKGYERINFLVANNNANAFMKCSDVTVAIAAIKKP